MNTFAGFIVVSMYLWVLFLVATVMADFLPQRWMDKAVRWMAGKDLEPYEKDGDPIATCKRCNRYAQVSDKNPNICTWCQSYEEYQDAVEDEQRRKHLERVRRERQEQKRAFYEAIEFVEESEKDR